MYYLNRKKMLFFINNQIYIQAVHDVENSSSVPKKKTILLSLIMKQKQKTKNFKMKLNYCF